MGNLQIAPEERDPQKIVDVLRQLTASGDALAATVAALAATVAGLPVAVPPGYKFISSAVASSSASVIFTGLSSTYDKYVVIGTDILPATDTVSFYIRVSEDNGSSFKSGAGNYGWAQFITTDVPSNSSSGNASDTQITVFTVASNNTARPLAFEAGLYKFSGTSHGKLIQTDSVQRNIGPNAVRWAGMGNYIGSNNAVNAIQFLFSSGNIASGTFRLYGIVNS